MGTNQRCDITASLLNTDNLSGQMICTNNWCIRFDHHRSNGV